MKDEHLEWRIISPLRFWRGTEWLTEQRQALCHSCLKLSTFFLPLRWTICRRIQWVCLQKMAWWCRQCQTVLPGRHPLLSWIVTRHMLNISWMTQCHSLQCFLLCDTPFQNQFLIGTSVRTSYTHQKANTRICVWLWLRGLYAVSSLRSFFKLTVLCTVKAWAALC